MARATTWIAIGLLSVAPGSNSQEAPTPVDCASATAPEDRTDSQPTAGRALEDFVVADDLVVGGRACVGSSCVNGEPFGVEDLKVKADTPELRLAHDPVSGSARDWGINADDTLFRIRDVTAATTPFSMRNGAPTFSLNVFADGTVAVGGGVLASQTSTLQVRRTDGTAKLLVEEASGTAASRNLLRIINRGAATFRFDNTATGLAWGFGALGSGNFFVGATPGQPLGFQLDASGNVTLTGTLTQGSDRDSKQSIEPVDAGALLEGVARLPLASWEYKGQAGVRHVGPMAQDFAAEFKLGADDRHLAPGDLAGVSLAAVQALKAENDRLRRAQQGLAAQLEQLAAEVRALQTQR